MVCCVRSRKSREKRSTTLAHAASQLQVPKTTTPNVRLQGLTPQPPHHITSQLQNTTQQHRLFYTYEPAMAVPLQKTAITPDAPNPPKTKNPTAPPVETTTAIRTRRFIILAFWAVVATLGLPHWIWTTSIHREELPVGEMRRWAEGNVSFCVLLGD
jgi:hypothetical protein